MSEQNSKQHSDSELIEQHVSLFFDEKLAGRQKQSILDAVQYVEALGAYGRGGHLQDMTIYALFKALKESVNAMKTANALVNGLTDYKAERDQAVANNIHLGRERDQIRAICEDNLKGDLFAAALAEEILDILNGKE